MKQKKGEAIHEEGDEAGHDGLQAPPKAAGEKHASAAAKKKQIVLSPERTKEVIDRLAHYEPRPLYEQTPGPYPIKYNPSARRIPFVFRSSNRFDIVGSGGASSSSDGDGAGLRPMLDIDDCRLVLPRERDVVISSGPRFAKQGCETANASKYDVEKGLRAIEPRAFAVVLAHHADQDANRSFNKSKATSGAPVARKEVVSSAAPFLSFSQELSSRGRISAAPRRTDEFFLLRSCSPGPIYAPNVDAVRPSPVYCKFSAAARTSSNHSTAGSARGCSEDGDDREVSDVVDLQKQYTMLSTWETAPSVRMRAPREEFHNPTKQRCPPPPPDDGGPLPAPSSAGHKRRNRSEQRHRIKEVMNGPSSLLQTSSGMEPPSSSDPSASAAAGEDVNVQARNKAGTQQRNDRPQSAPGDRSGQTQTQLSSLHSRPGSAISRSAGAGVASMMLPSSSPFSSYAISDLKLSTITVMLDDASQQSDRAASSIGYSRPSSAMTTTKLRVRKETAAVRNSEQQVENGGFGDVVDGGCASGSSSPARRSIPSYDLRGSHGGSFSRMAAQAASLRAVKRRSAYPARQSHLQRTTAQFWTSSGSL